MGLSSIWYQINQREKRNFLNPTFKKVPLRRPIKELCSFHCYKNGTRCPIKGNLSYTTRLLFARPAITPDSRSKITYLLTYKLKCMKKVDIIRLSQYIS